MMYLRVFHIKPTTLGVSSIPGLALRLRLTQQRAEVLFSTVWFVPLYQEVPEFVFRKTRKQTFHAKCKVFSERKCISTPMFLFVMRDMLSSVIWFQVVPGLFCSISKMGSVF